MKELQKIRDDLYVPRDFEKDHNYYADPEGKKRYTGITTALSVIAKPALIAWAARMTGDFLIAALASGTPISKELIEEAKKAHTRKNEDAKEHGTKTHALVEDYIKFSIKNARGIPEMTMRFPEWEPIKPFIEWAMQNVDHFLFSERRMANTEHFIAGTADFAAVMKDGKKLIGDFKTSSGVYGVDYFLQCAAYKFIAESEGDAPYDGSVIVRLGKDGSFDVHYRYANETDVEAFLAALTLYRAQSTFTPAMRRT